MGEGRAMRAREMRKLRDISGAESAAVGSVSVCGLVVGISGPKVVRLAGGREATVTTVHVIDDSDDVGMDLRLWGGDAVRYAGLRGMDVVVLRGVYVLGGGKRGFYLGVRGGSVVERVVKGGGEGERMLRWRDERFEELVRMVGEGRVGFGGEWEGGKVGVLVDRGKRRRVERGWEEWTGVGVVGVRLRGEGSVGEGLRGGIGRVCMGCGRGRCESCVGGGRWEWEFGRVYVIVGSKGVKGRICTAKGKAVERLLLGLTAGEVREGGTEVEEKCERIMQGLVDEKDKLRVVVRRNDEEVGGWELGDVFVDV